MKDHAAGQPSGYVLEARIPWELLFDPTEAVTNTITPDQLVGFSIFGNDGDDPAAPTQEKALSLTERAGPSNNPSSWDTVQMDGPSAPAPPTLGIARAAADLIITYTGTLQSAAQVTGPYSDVSGATSPLTVKPSDPATFYRARQWSTDLLNETLRPGECPAFF